MIIKRNSTATPTPAPAAAIKPPVTAEAPIPVPPKPEVEPDLRTPLEKLRDAAQARIENYERDVRIFNLFTTLAQKYNKRIVVFDTETTGQHFQQKYKRLGITEIAWCEVTPTGGINHRSILLNPEEPISDIASEITGITQALVENEPNFGHFHKVFKTLFDDAIVMGFNSNSYDWKVVDGNFSFYKKPPAVPYAFVDVRDLWVAITGVKKGTLSGIAELRNIKPRKDAHRAYADVDVTMEIFTDFMEKDAAKMEELLSTYLQAANVGEQPVKTSELSDRVVLNDYPKQGSKWLPEDLNLLRESIEQGVDVFTLSKKLGRKPSTLHGKITNDGLSYHIDSVEAALIREMMALPNNVRYHLDPQDPYLFLKTPILGNREFVLDMGTLCYVHPEYQGDTVVSLPPSSIPALTTNSPTEP